MKTAVAKTLFLAISLIFAVSVSAAESGRAMDGKTMGKLIRQSKVENYTLNYHLLENSSPEAMKGMEMDHSKMEMKSHHLMIYPLSPDNKPVKGATAGFLVIDPGGNKSQAMAAAMTEGYGADVEMKAKGVYTIRAKMVVSGKVLVDEFKHEIK